MSDQAIAEIRTEAQTQALAHGLAPLLRPSNVLLLDGPLGAGKTTFVRALAGALGATETVSSPTFVTENRYALREGELLHVDLYRLDGRGPQAPSEAELLASMLEARDEGAMLAIEWGAGWSAWLQPLLALEIELNGERRVFRLRALPGGWKHLARLREAWGQIA